MTLEDRLERLANRTAPRDPDDVLAAARRRAEADRHRRTGSPRVLAAAAAVIAVVALAAGAFALTSTDGDTVTVAGPDALPLLDGQWLLTATVTDNEIRTAQAQASVTIDGDTVTGDDGCGNDLQAQLSGGRVAYDEFHSLAGCLDEPGSSDANRFWHVIEAQPRYEVRDRELWMLADDGDALVFVSADSAPPEHASPVGNWELHSVSADGEPIAFSTSIQDPWLGIGADGTLTGAYPCNGFGGTVEIRGQRLVVTSLGQDLMGCEGAEGAAESALSRLLHSDPTWEIRDGALLLSGAGVDAEFSGRSEPTQPAANGGVDGPVLYGPEQHGEMEQALLSGRLLLEGDCLYLLQESDAARYTPLPVVWPYGATWQVNPDGVRLPDGTVVPVGALFTASGGIYDIDRLVELGHAESVAGRARQCGPDVPAVAYLQVEVVEGDWRTVELLWFEMVNDSSLEVTLAYCGSNFRLDVEETGEAVTIRAGTSDPEFPPAPDCATAGAVALDSPLGSRQVIDAVTGATVEQR